MPAPKTKRKGKRPDLAALMQDAALHDAARLYAAAQATFYTEAVMDAYADLRAAEGAYVQQAMQVRDRGVLEHYKVVQPYINKVLGAMPAAAQVAVEQAGQAWASFFLADGLTRDERREIHKVLAYYQWELNVPLFPPITRSK